MNDASVTRWLGILREGDPEAIQRLWEAYFPKLVRLAQQRLRGLPRTAFADGEDVAASAFASFVQAVEEGRFPRLDDRDDLWQVLIVLTVRKAANLVEHETAGKRNIWATQYLSALSRDGIDDSGESFSDLLQANDPPPELAFQMADEVRSLLKRFEDDEFRQIAQLKMEGFTNPEIAAKLRCSRPTVERRLRLIRKRWEAELPE